MLPYLLHVYGLVVSIILKPGEFFGVGYNTLMKYKNKKEFFERTENEWNKLWELVDDFTDEQLKKRPSQRTGSMVKSGDSWNTVDMLMHLHEWHNMSYGWYKQGLKKEKVDMPKEGYKWSEIPALNKEIFLKYKNTSPKTAKKKVRSTHAKLLNLIKSLSEKQFLRSGQYEWTGENSVSTYLAPSLGGHYKWAHDTIKKSIKKWD